MATEKHLMTKRRKSTRSRQYNNQSNAPSTRGKSAREAEIERLTWFFLVLIFAVVQLLSDSSSIVLPGWFVPLAGAVVLLGSGIYQYSRHYRVSPVTWLGGGLLLIFVTLNLYANYNRSFVGESLLVFAGVILAGLLTGET
jgi:hypothetical protein